LYFTFQNCIQFIFHNEFNILGEWKLGRSTFQHPNRTSGTMVRSVRTVNVYRCLLWLQEKGKIIYKFISFYYSMFVNNWDNVGFRASGTNKSNSSANTRAKFLHTTNTRSCHGWCPAIWLHIYTIILYT